MKTPLEGLYSDIANEIAWLQSNRKWSQVAKSAHHTCSPLEWWHLCCEHLKSNRANCSVLTPGRRRLDFQILLEVHFNSQLFKSIPFQSQVSAFQHHCVPLWTAVPALFPLTRSCPALFCMEICCDMLRKCAEVRPQLMVAECFSTENVNYSG